VSEKCQRCNEVDYDRRTIWMNCFYDMSELDIPFSNITIKSDPTDTFYHFYTLRVCKDCRAQWMQSIKNWFNSPEKPASSGSGIFIRENGACVEISEEEFAKRYPGREPVRVKQE
jgi:hypothetical protein